MCSAATAAATAAATEATAAATTAAASGRRRARGRVAADVVAAVLAAVAAAEHMYNIGTCFSNSYNYVKKCRAWFFAKLSIKTSSWSLY